MLRYKELIRDKLSDGVNLDEIMTIIPSDGTAMSGRMYGYPVDQYNECFLVGAFHR